MRSFIVNIEYILYQNREKRRIKKESDIMKRLNKTLSDVVKRLSK